MEQMEGANLLADGLREEDRVGTGNDLPLESTSLSLFERGTAFPENKLVSIDRHEMMITDELKLLQLMLGDVMHETHHLPGR